MAQSALEKEVKDACRTHEARKNPKAAKARLANSSERRRGRNIVRNLPTVEVLRELLKRERAIESRKQATERKRRSRAALRLKKA